MELRSYNVEKVWNACVKCRLKNSIGVDKQAFQDHIQDINDMVNQIYTEGRCIKLRFANVRKDYEIWTPYLQIVEMLILMGARTGVLKFDGDLNEDTLIIIENEKAN